ncbi:hypothetical protein CB0940_03064 [Cercospora beticola]|uniref:DUF1308 domain-containing protein n=1 Tax=Cercospora beticola TaxID=122368 RepID=A0A2G5I2J3_CERBT|nr:hypothetical protein CB0940_03064 [Cercospora beticola]PIA99007.1 hypothetical protein CB0940_03064 [Cercospora beticola]WPB00230.1 hypothetical protein RHO25_004849 [Cercospora beticola]CAK1361575.1 unnamed protein product [Cercospora beticola]
MTETHEGGEDNDEGHGGEAHLLLANLISRAKALLAELEQFRQHLRIIRQEQHIELAHFRGTIQSELSMLEKLHSKPETDSTTHVAKSSNLPFLETVWKTAKKSSHVGALQKRVYYNSPSKSLSSAMHHINLGIKRPSEKGSRNAAVTVDLIADQGLTWTKVSLVTNHRILMDLAKQGWDSGGSEDEEDDDLPPRMDDDDADMPLVKNAKELCQASESYRVRTQKPKVNLVLPRIQLGETKEVDAVIERCRAAGVTLFCGESVGHVPAIQEALQTMAPDPINSFTNTLNIDCTILLALVSEFSHASVSKEPWFHKSLQRQVEIEDNENLLPSLLYPALAKRELVCTSEAAKRMREIVDTIGTPSEKARTAIMMGDDTSKTHGQLIEDMQQWSAYPVPSDWQLPIRVVNRNDDDCQKEMHPIAVQILDSMSKINSSVFGYGWTSGNTTITSNRVVVKQVENELEKCEDLDDAVWPKIWLCPTARSLVGKEKRGASKKDVKALPDPLRREQQRRNGLDVLSQRAGHQVEDLRPDGYPCEDVLAAKEAASKAYAQNGTQELADNPEK